MLFEKAQRLQATDIHLETKQQQFILILLRIDGVVGPLKMPEHIGAQQCVSRLKVLANLDITKQTQPQEGYFAHTLATSQTQHIRVSCLPTKQGEKIALRLLTMGTLTQEHTFLALGMSAAMAKTIEDHLRAPQGLFLVTGPTGSGKTQTLYQCLKQLQRQPRLLYSIEDPVESELDGVTQIEVNSDTDFNFASAFKALLRQDPDVIMIGEIRDAQTAKLVFQAAQTGHLILASLHTQDTTSALIRLHQLGISALEMATTLSIVIAQRLIRTFCQHCLGQGCYACIDGYLGRTALFEVSQWPMGTTCFSLEELLSISKKHCHQSLMQHGLEKVQSKLTSLSEVHRLFPIEHS